MTIELTEQERLYLILFLGVATGAFYKEGQSSLAQRALALANKLQDPPVKPQDQPEGLAIPD